jgi:hypothetical protein
MLRALQLSHELPSIYSILAHFAAINKHNGNLCVVLRIEVGMLNNVDFVQCKGMSCLQ